MKSSRFFLLSFGCFVLASQASPLPHPRGKSNCQLEPLPLPSPSNDAKPASDEPPASDANQVPAPASEPQEDRADLDVVGTLARATPKERMRVTVWAKNRGTSSWTPKDVRIIVRWVDFDAGTRRRWSFNWIKEVVPPMGQMRQALDVPVPPRAGRYKVIYGLVRLPSGGKNGQAPPYNASQNKWPGEFAAVAFAVNVGDAPAAPSTP